MPALMGRKIITLCFDIEVVDSECWLLDHDCVAGCDIDVGASISSC